MTYMQRSTLESQFDLIMAALASNHTRYTTLRMQRSFSVFLQEMALFWKHHRHVWGKANVNHCSSLRCGDLSYAFCGLALWIAFTSVQCCLLSCAQSLSAAIDSSSAQIHTATLPTLKNMQWNICVLNERMFLLFNWCTMWEDVDAYLKWKKHHIKWVDLKFQFSKYRLS